MRKNLSYFYGICDVPNEDVFQKQGVAIEKKLRPSEKKNSLKMLTGA